MRAFIVEQVLTVKSRDADSPEAAAVANKARHYAKQVANVYGGTISPLPYVAKRKDQPGQDESKTSIVGKRLKRPQPEPATITTPAAVPIRIFRVLSLMVARDGDGDVVYESSGPPVMAERCAHWLTGNSAPLCNPWIYANAALIRRSNKASHQLLADRVTVPA